MEYNSHFVIRSECVGVFMIIPFGMVVCKACWARVIPPLWLAVVLVYFLLRVLNYLFYASFEMLVLL